VPWTLTPPPSPSFTHPLGHPHVADSADSYAVLIAAGAVPKVMELLAKSPAAVLAAPAQLLAAMCRSSSAAADQAIGVS
jgi:hypothetical protein